MKNHITFENFIGLVSLVVLPVVLFIMLPDVDEFWKKTVFIVATLLMFFGNTLPFVRRVINHYSTSRNS